MQLLRILAKPPGEGGQRQQLCCPT